MSNGKSYSFYFLEDVLLSFNIDSDLLRPVNKLLLEFELEVVFGLFSDLEGAVNLGDGV